ncbi:MAG: CPBP family intramembrane metalloprotease [Clostridia bacterium]|nr:CPBP family intramembrane metalloprotease [Clostridia bacterium]MBO4797395.1 CPBP family intramembrane metalloprotease [Candidatus Methanomethylophilaceae archaeon]MBQ4290149.1 CPBP family intramembrane metalloprotease [Clostridia bacterium]
MSVRRALTVPLLPLFVFAALFFSEQIDMNRLMGSRGAYLSFVIIQLLCIYLPVVFYCKAREIVTASHLKIRPFGLEKAVFLLFSVFFMIFAMTAVELVMQSIGVGDGLYAHSVFHLYGRDLPDLGTNVYDTLYIAVVFAVMPALGEELLFRSVLFSEYESLGAPAAIFLTALLHAFLPMNFTSLLPSFVGGLILGFTVYITQSVLASLAVHFLYNLYALFIQEYIWAYISKPENTLFFAILLSAALLFSLILILSQAEHVMYGKGIRSEYAPSYVSVDVETRRFFCPDRKYIAIAFISPTFILCAVLFVIRAAGWF